MPGGGRAGALRRTTNGARRAAWWVCGTARRRFGCAFRRRWNALPDGRYEALAVAPLAGGRLDPPDIALFYATPGAMIYFINGLQWSGYKRFDWSVVARVGVRRFPGGARSRPARQACRSRALPNRRYGGVLRRRDADGVATRLSRERRSAGMEALAKNGLRYPFPAIPASSAGCARRHGDQLTPAEALDRRCLSAQPAAMLPAIDGGHVGGGFERHARGAGKA